MCTSWNLFFYSEVVFFFIGHTIIIVQVRVCKTFGTNNMIHASITPSISYQMRWLDDNDKAMGYSSWSPRLKPW